MSGLLWRCIHQRLSIFKVDGCILTTPYPPPGMVGTHSGNSERLQQKPRRMEVFAAPSANHSRVLTTSASVPPVPALSGPYVSICVTIGIYIHISISISMVCACAHKFPDCANGWHRPSAPCLILRWPVSRLPLGLLQGGAQGLSNLTPNPPT